MTERSEVYAAIDGERAYQLSRAEAVSGPGSGEHKHSVEEYLLYMQDYLNEAIHQASRIWTASGEIDVDHPALHTLRKVTAMGVACMEQNGAPRREGF